MDKELIERSIRVSLMITILFAPFAFLYFGYHAAWGFVAGAGWNIANVYLLSRLVMNLITPLPSGKQKISGAMAGVFKFPVLYGIGYGIIRYTDVSPYGILAGFSLILAVFALKALGIYYLNTSFQNRNYYGRNT